jgi:hypothetical protein
MYIRQMLESTLLVLLFTVVMTRGQELLNWHGGRLVSGEALGWGIGLHALLVLLMLRSLVREASTMWYRGGRRLLQHLRSAPWVPLGWATYGLVVVAQVELVLQRGQGQGFRICSALAAVLLWLRLVYMFRAFKKMG